MNHLVYNFNTKISPELTQVGGKAKSLISLTKAGLPVPAGIELTVNFFTEWTQQIKSSSVWETLLINPNKNNCDAAKAMA